MCIYIFTKEYYSASERKEILIHATTWIKLEDIMLLGREENGELLYGVSDWEDEKSSEDSVNGCKTM